jgi:hypothetical protein
MQVHDGKPATGADQHLESVREPVSFDGRRPNRQDGSRYGRTAAIDDGRRTPVLSQKNLP